MTTWIFLLLLSSPDIARLLAESNIPNADVVLARHHVRTEVKPTGASTVVETKLYRVLTPKGASLLTTLTFDQDPHTNTVEIVSVRACRPDGACRNWPHEVKSVPAPAGWILWRFNLQILTLPALDPGDGLEIITRKKGFMIAYLRNDENEFVPPMKGHFYDQVLFGEEPFPTLEKEYELVLPPGMRIHAREYNGAIASQTRYAPQATTYIWKMRNLPAFIHEPMMPQPSDSLPKVVLATVPDWETKSRWFYEVNAKQFDATPEIRAKVDEILRGATVREQKLERLTRWVANNIRYRGFSMGPAEGYTLHAGSQVFAERAGVCKDIASMLVTMLRAAGFDAYPAMTMAGARVEDEPADQFNHSVVAVRNPDGTFTLLDPTWAPLDRYIWSYAEREQHYVIGTPEGRSLERIPASDPQDNLLRLSVNSRIIAGGILELNASLQGRGYSDTSLRRAIGYTPLAERDRAGNPFVRKLPPDARLTRFAHTDPLNFDSFVRLDASIRMTSPYIKIDDVLQWKPISMRVLPEYDRLMPWLSLPSNPNRRHPVLLRSNMVVEIEETFEQPQMTPIHLPPAVAVRTPAAELKASARVQGRRIMFSARLILPNRQIPASSYTDLVNTVQAFLKLADFSVLLEVGK